MGKESDPEIVIPTFRMPDLTRTLGDEDIQEIEKLDRNERRTAMAIGKLTLICNELVQHVVLLTEAVRQMRKQQERQAILDGKVVNRVVWYESKMKVVAAILLTSVLSGLGAKFFEWILKSFQH